MKAKIPIALIYARLVMGFVLVALSLMHIANYSILAIALLSAGLLSDIFDGIIARQLNISTQKLRRMDSTVDMLFFLSVILATFIQCPGFFYANYLQLIILSGLEGLTYLICFIKFRKEIATHAISSKLWTLLLFATLIEIIITCNSHLLFQLCFYTGLITRLEIIAIVLVLKEWTNDVPSLYHALLIRQGKPIKKKKLFNG